MEINKLKIGDVYALNRHPDSPHEQAEREGEDIPTFDEICKYCLTKFSMKPLKSDKNRARTIVNHYRSCDVVKQYLMKDAVFRRNVHKISSGYLKAYGC